MYFKVYFIVYASLMLINGVVTQYQEGDSCVDSYTNSAGRCTFVGRCNSAREVFEQNGIRPTFCQSGANSLLVCCRDGFNILQTAPPTEDSASQAPVWENDSSYNPNARVSERKCAEFSRLVTRDVGFLPLLPNARPQTLSTPNCSYTGVELIVGGTNAELGEFPHMAAIGWTNYDGGYSFSCGGSLISTRFVLTAGHCIHDPRARDPVPKIVRLGDRNIDPSVDDGAHPVEVAIRNIIPHPDYAPPTRYNDIALLELATDVKMETNIRPACLWTEGEKFPQRSAIATGWGTTGLRQSQPSNELQKVSLDVIDNAACDRLLQRNRHWWGFMPTQMCAGKLEGGKDTCQGDSGAPLQLSKENKCVHYIIGLTSFGGKCAKKMQPAIYTRVSAYLDWIERTVWPGQ